MIGRLPGAVAIVITACVAATAARAQAPVIVDTHVHVDGRLERRDVNWAGAARIAVDRMNEAGVRLSLVLPPPQPPGFLMPWECDDYASALQAFPGRFASICGGGTINPLIYESAGRPVLDAATAQRLEALVAGFASRGAVAIGELTAQHFAFNSRHPYMGMAPDHPVLLKLADLAARYRLPLVVHMEAVRGSFDMPEGLRRASGQNPARIDDNLAAFERLLAHNRGATIVWAHFGWDNSGQRNGRLMKELFDRHANLYADIKLQPGSPSARFVFDDRGAPRAEFIAAVEAGGNRYMVGSDAFYAVRPVPAEREVDRLAAVTRTLLDRLRPDTRRLVASETAATVYRLRERGLLQP